MEHINIGDISFYSNRAHWKIPYFLHIPQKINTSIHSPRFKFGDRNWKIIIYPNGRRSMYSLSVNDSTGWFGMEASISKTYENSSKVDVRFGIVGEHEVDIVNYRAVSLDSVYFRSRLIRNSAIESDKNRVVPGGQLHVFLSVEKFDSPVKPATQDKVKDGTEKLQSATTEASTQTEECIGTSELRRDLKEMLIRGNISDIILKVEGREFKVHRFVLAARSPVLLDMIVYDNDEKGKNTGVVELPHFDPNIFHDFLNYLYTGNVENINSENAKELFSIADSYKVSGLRKICLHHIMRDISIENFCDVLAVSFRHGEVFLKEACTQFFVKNSLDIVLTPKWKEFLSVNPEGCNELFVKKLQIN